MAKSATSFKPGQSGNAKGRPALTPEQREARDMRARFQPDGVRELIRIATSADEDKDRIAALRILVEELPTELLDLTEREPTRPFEEVLAAGLGALVLRQKAKGEK